MANVIKVKRGTSTPTTSNLANIGEFAFDYSANKVLHKLFVLILLLIYQGI